LRQGEVASKGKWVGNPQGGVTAPEPIILPDAKTCFARSAARLDVLAEGHPMAPWLNFMAGLMRAQHAAAAAFGPLPAPDIVAVQQASEAGMPPLAADGHGRIPAWRHALATLLDALDLGQAPEAARDIAADLRRRDAASLEALADCFLHGTIDDAGATLFIAAALQVHFTSLAAALPVEALRLLPERGLCPCCGSLPVAGIITGSGATPGTRYLQCSLCSTAWNHVRAICITCGDSRTLALKSIDGDAGVVKAETCDACHSYAKMLYQAKDMQVDAMADDLASLGLDVMVAEAGWARHAPNPLLLAG
jgi:FdhE protein